MLRATFWSLSLCAFCRATNAEPGVSIVSPPAIAVPATIDSAKCAEVLIGTSISPFNVGPPVPPLPTVREVVEVRDKKWIHEFAALIRTGVDVTPARWGGYIRVDNAPVVFVLPDGKRFTLLSVGESTIWMTKDSQGILKMPKLEGDALCAMIAAKRNEKGVMTKVGFVSNQLPDPTSPSVTPPAGAGGAPSVAADH